MSYSMAILHECPHYLLIFIVIVCTIYKKKKKKNAHSTFTEVKGG